MKCLNLIGRDQGNSDNEKDGMQHLLGCSEGGWLSAETMEGLWTSIQHNTTS